MSRSRTFYNDTFGEVLRPQNSFERNEKFICFIWMKIAYFARHKWKWIFLDRENSKIHDLKDRKSICSTNGIHVICHVNNIKTSKAMAMPALNFSNQTYFAWWFFLLLDLLVSHLKFATSSNLNLIDGQQWNELGVCDQIYDERTLFFIQIKQLNNTSCSF